MQLQILQAAAVRAGFTSCSCGLAHYLPLPLDWSVLCVRDLPLSLSPLSLAFSLPTLYLILLLSLYKAQQAVPIEVAPCCGQLFVFDLPFFTQAQLYFACSKDRGTAANELHATPN